MEPLGDGNAKIGFGSGVVQGLRRALGTRIVLLFGNRAPEPPKGFHIDINVSAESTVLTLHKGEYSQPTYQLSIAPGITRVRQEFGSNDEILVALDDYKVVHSVDTANTKGHVSIHITHGPKENPNSVTLLINLPEGSRWHYCADQPIVFNPQWLHLRSIRNQSESQQTPGLDSNEAVATDGNNVREEKVEQPPWVNQGTNQVTNLNPASEISSGITLDPEADRGITISTNDTDDEPVESSDFIFLTSEEIAEINAQSVRKGAKTFPP